MSVRNYQCTQCNTVFSFDTNRDQLFCPLCGSTAKYVKGGTVSNSSAATTTISGYSSVKFTDSNLKVTVGAANVPNGWSYATEIRNVIQSKMNPYQTNVQVSNKAGSIVMFARSGENYLDVRDGIGNDTHQDGVLNNTFSTPMLRILSTKDYLNKLAPSIINVSNLKEVSGGSLPSYYGTNATAAKKALNSDANDFGAEFEGTAVTYKVVNSAVESYLERYSYTSGKTKGVLLLGMDMGAFEFTVTQPKSSQPTSVMGLLGSLISTNTAAQSGNDTGDYINWGSRLIFGCVTDEANYNTALEAFTQFVGSYKVDSKLAGKKEAIIKALNSTNNNTVISTTNTNTNTQSNGSSLMGDLLSGLFGISNRSSFSDAEGEEAEVVKSNINWDK